VDHTVAVCIRHCLADFEKQSEPFGRGECRHTRVLIDGEPFDVLHDEERHPIEALERDDARRAGFLAEACAGDVALLAEVASLLASYEQDQNFLQTPAFNLSAADLAGSVLDEEGNRVSQAPRVSGFRLIREVGHGGMGAVYEAFAYSTNGEQRVAVKLVKRGMESEFILHRFERERRILGALDHPYVARLLDGGATEQSGDDEGVPSQSAWLDLDD
jgi:hypothetical protein